MASLNKALLIGNLTRDPELKYTPNGSAVTNFTVAVNRAFTLQTGEKKEETSFIRVIVWGKRAEVCAEYLSKGSQVFVEGRIQTRNWEAQDGSKRTATEVVALSVQFLGRPKGSGASQASNKEGVSQVSLNDASDIDVAPLPDHGASEDDIPF